MRKNTADNKVFTNENGNDIESKSSNSFSSDVSPKKKKKKKQRDNDNYLQKEILKNSFAIPYEDIKFVKKLAEGAFGEVFLGNYLGQDVAIKQFRRKSKKSRTEEFKNFEKEVEV